MLGTRDLSSLLSFLLFALPMLAAEEAADSPEFFETRIRPLLAEKCFVCHTTSQMGGLRLDSREALLKGGNTGYAIVPGHPDQSLLIRAVSHKHERLKMPPQGKLKEEEVADLISWVKAGAMWPESSGSTAPPQKTGTYVITPEQRAFWAFQPIRKPALPKVKDKAWLKSPIDTFILSQVEARGLKPVVASDKRTWIRRATFDLIGLPPTLEEVEAFAKDSSPKAYARVIDRLLASPRYGERWGRYWLDVARYSDDKLDSTKEDPHPNAFRYRDWVIQAFNEDMPYDLFVKAQIAGDLLEGQGCEKLVAGLGFYALSPEFQDDRVDVTTRGFLGLTVACAQCHDHKYDPIPTQDYYSLLGVFANTKLHEFPLAPEAAVTEYQKHKKKVDDQEAALKEFIRTQSAQLGEILAAKTSKYLVAAWKLRDSQEEKLQTFAQQEGLDQPTLERWVKYLKTAPKEHPYLKPLEELGNHGGTEEEFKKEVQRFQSLVLRLIREKKAVDEKNLILLGGATDRRSLSQGNLVSLERDKYFLWRDLFAEEPTKNKGGVFYYGDLEIDRFLHGEWKAHLEAMRAELAELKRTLPPQYPFLQVIKDSEKPANLRVYIRGNKENLGEEAPRRFLSILSEGEPAPFTKGSGRLELAQAIANPKNPLTARVMVNRIWQHHFGNGIARTPSNFGQLGDRPSHPELLDYLASRFIENNWSIKTMHREIMLSATYALSTERSEKNFAVDPDNRLLWRANRRRLDIEALRDSLLFVSGKLDLRMGGPPARLTDENNRRTVYGYVSRRKLDSMLALFDFPNPNSTSEQRIVTSVPLQQLFFLNSTLILRQAQALAGCLKADHKTDDAARIRKAYQTLFGRAPTSAELQLGLEFLQAGEKSWLQYAQVLLSSNEFLYVN